MWVLLLLQQGNFNPNLPVETEMWVSAALKRDRETLNMTRDTKNGLLLVESVDTAEIQS